MNPRGPERGLSSKPTPNPCRRLSKMVRNMIKFTESQRQLANHESRLDYQRAQKTIQYELDLARERAKQATLALERERADTERECADTEFERADRKKADLELESLRTRNQALKSEISQLRALLARYGHDFQET